MSVDYHHHRLHKTEHNFPFSALGPGQSRVLWIVNKSQETVTVDTPQRARYARFPDLSTFQGQRFLPALTDWICSATRTRSTASISPLCEVLPAPAVSQSYHKRAEEKCFHDVDTNACSCYNFP